MRMIWRMISLPTYSQICKIHLTSYCRVGYDELSREIVAVDQTWQDKTVLGKGLHVLYRLSTSGSY